MYSLYCRFLPSVGFHRRDTVSKRSNRGWKYYNTVEQFCTALSEHFRHKILKIHICAHGSDFLDNIPV